MSTSYFEITMPELKGPRANEHLEKLLSELRRNSELKGFLDLSQTKLKRVEEEAQDFGATLLAVLGTSAVTYLARALFRYVERTGTHVIVNGIEIKNVRSEDIPKIVQALSNSQPVASRTTKKTVGG